ncbi:uncharacterized protein N7482_003936 [Penicillium canariense]|uniref:Nucleic acid-binding, OB-fold protein n=1 Tax=Penicillium canariense TaxID=189055 RepID=A0A9W9LP45_9EURO|nr:uncharacterized protein N7482_003936 [Penicillium canariense]KAJ5168342.1 hypothetical protein N7482_003936 [Penicillium canariense]
MVMSPNTIFLMGAPLPGSLDWEKDELLNSAIQPFQGTDTIDEHQSFLVQSRVSAKWRALQPLCTELPTDYHAFYHGPENPNFLSTHQLVTADNESMDEDSVLSEFYNHSFVVHETSEMFASGSREEESTQESGPQPETLEAPTTCSSAEELVHGLPPSLRIPGPLSDLQDLPTARHLQSITPQTVTVNLVVGVIAVHPPRRIVTRQWKTELDIIELIVGDETRTGFAVNFWVPPEKPTAAKTPQADHLSRSLAMLRPQDIILLRTVGLSSFRNRVYGQSLRGGMTRVDLLHRRPGDTTDAAGFYKSGFELNSLHDLHDDLPRQKARRVREWVLQFVGATDGAGGSLSGMSQAQRGHRQLPPDTQ